VAFPFNMPKRKRSAADRTGTLFPPPISRERAYELVRRVPIGSNFWQRGTRCHTPGCYCATGRSHGPYWFASPGRGPCVYVGTDEARALVEAAWVLVGAELAAAEAKVDATEEGRRLRELRELAALLQKASSPAPKRERSSAA